MTLGEFRQMTKDLPDSTPIMYHAYDNGCCHALYSHGWNYVDNENKCVVLNPGDDFDDRRPHNMRHEEKT